MVRHPAVSLSLSTLRVDSKHVLNSQVSIRAPCCKQWFDCAECHAETQSHRLAKSTEMTFICKKCKKAFRKDATEFDESDEYCPHCDNHFVSVESTSFAAATERNILGSGRRDAQSCVASRRRGSKAGREVRDLLHPVLSGSLTWPLGCSKTNAQRSTQAARSTIKIRQIGWGDLRSSACEVWPISFPAISCTCLSIRTGSQRAITTLDYPCRAPENQPQDLHIFPYMSDLQSIQYIPVFTKKSVKSTNKNSSGPVQGSKYHHQCHYSRKPQDP